MAIPLSRTFVLRKLHQLSGIVPLGLFVLEHFYTNSKAINGAGAFNEAVKDLQAIPYILLIEIGGIFIPLIYHAVYGLVITMEARPNNLNYPYPTKLVLSNPAKHGRHPVLLHSVSCAQFPLRVDAGTK